MKFNRMLALVLAVLTALSVAGGAMADEGQREKIVIGLELSTNVEDYDTNEYTKFLEEQMNVDIEFFLFQDMKQKLPVMISSNSDLPDIILGTQEDAAMVNWTSQGVFQPLTEYWNNPEMTKHFDQRLAELGETEALKKHILSSITMPDGEIYSLPLYDENVWNMREYRLWLNTDWLEALKLEVPTTLDEFADVLRHFANDDPNGNGQKDEIPLIGSTAWGCDPSVYLLNSFIHANPDVNYINVENGKVVPAYTQDAFKAGLEYLNGLYNEGLIYPLSFTQDGTQMKAAVNDDTVLCGSVVAGSTSNFTSEARMAQYTIIPPLVGPEGVHYAASKEASVKGLAYITRSAKNPELCFRLLENNYDFVWRMNFRYGIEGKNWTSDPETLSQYIGDFESLGYMPTYVVLDSVWGKVQNITWNAEIMPYLLPQTAVMMGGAKKARTAENAGYVSANATHYKGYADCAPAEMIGTLIHTEEENEVLAAIQPTITEYVKEMVMAFITGNASFDQWDSFQNELKVMGLEDYVTVLQAAYDRKVGSN